MGTAGGSDPLVDVHVHLYPDQDASREAMESYEIWEYGDDPGVDFAMADGDITGLNDSYGQAGFDRAIVVHLFDAALARTEALGRLAPGLTAEMPDVAATVNAAVAEAMLASNRWVAAAARANPLIEVLIGVDPTVLTARQMTDQLTELADAGVRGVKLHPVAQGYLPIDPRMHSVYDLCAEAGLVVLSHSGPGHNADASAKPSEFAPVLKRWPNLKLVLAHLGGASWQEAADLADAFPQVVFDLSEVIEWDGAPNAPSAADLAALVKHIGADRIMLGSDFPWYDPARTADRASSLPGLGPQERAAILGGTAAAFFDLEQTKT
jgi:predicted TIM-barrel fold metal-dependent hydrolase